MSRACRSTRDNSWTSCSDPTSTLIEGLQPTICIDQRAGQLNRRSTVATVTEIYDYLRLLMARLGQPTATAAVRRSDSSRSSRSRTACWVAGRHQGDDHGPDGARPKGEPQGSLCTDSQGRLRPARVDGAVVDLDEIPALSPRRNHHIDAVVDRVIIRRGVRARVGESIRLAVQHGDGLAVVCYLTPEQESREGTRTQWPNELFSTQYACPDCNLSYEELEPRTFSFNSPYGACPVCEGLGTMEEFDPELVLPDSGRSASTGGAIEPWKALTPKWSGSSRKSLEPFPEDTRCRTV